jgi:hypothetical protein
MTKLAFVGKNTLTEIDFCCAQQFHVEISTGCMLM